MVLELLALVVAFVLATPALFASKFVITQAATWQFSSIYEGSIGVGAYSSAKYNGPPDANDYNWEINADLYAEQGDNVRPDGYWPGDGNSGSGVYEGKVISCPKACGGQGNVPECDANYNSVSYHATGKAVIYHQYNPDISTADGGWGSTQCTPPQGGSCTTNGTYGYDPADTVGSGGCCEEQCSPIVLNLQRGFSLSGPTPPVQFDIDADGDLDSISWTRLAPDEAFLVLDRDGDGVITSGAELFGVATEQPPSDDPNGFNALAVYDGLDFGGNEDGLISAGDAVFEDLRLWLDENRNGYSEPTELHTLPSEGIQAIVLDYVWSRHRDQYGNELRWASRALLADGSESWSVSDVIFVRAPQ